MRQAGSFNHSDSVRGTVRGSRGNLGPPAASLAALLDLLRPQRSAVAADQVEFTISCWRDP
jgi:hypothetical protein